MWLIFFQDECGEIASCKTYIKNVIVALSRNAPSFRNFRRMNYKVKDVERTFHKDE